MVKVLDTSEGSVIVKIDRDMVFDMEDAGFMVDPTFSSYDIRFPGRGVEAGELLKMTKAFLAETAKKT